MVGESGTSRMKKKVHRYYKCVSVKKHQGCDKKAVRKDWIEDLTIAFIRTIMFDDDLVYQHSQMGVAYSTLFYNTIHQF